MARPPFRFPFIIERFDLCPGCFFFCPLLSQTLLLCLFLFLMIFFRFVPGKENHANNEKDYHNPCHNNVRQITRHLILSLCD